ncbi:hypothetical protein BN938_1692 [Mucinivorans hirudinis]|uniref:Uncharacterized protein n=1 Tax=Mucinivorans hirudinis TaxID=1433126 RepID=A0A060R8I7_9BACT|nr:hypothetical protein BN938_1692 [Mucinivorans hirudinis]
MFLDRVQITVSILLNKQPYREPELHDHNPRKQKKQIRNYLNRLSALGVDVSVFL